jgi:hypothetical protein
MNEEFRHDIVVEPWGPLISPKYEKEGITNTDIVVASVVFFLTLVNAVIAVWLACVQTKVSRSPLRSVYVWMIWLELIVCVIMGAECYLHLLKYIPPSELMSISMLNMADSL